MPKNLANSTTFCIFLFSFLFSFQTSQGQKLKTGISLDIYALHLTHFSEDYFFSTRSYKMFYLDKTQMSSSFHVNYAGLIRIDYSRVSASFEFSERIDQGFKLCYDYPIAGEQFLTYYSKIEFGEFNMMPSISYSFMANKMMRPFAELGICFATPAFIKENVSTDPNFASASYDVTEIKKYFKMDKPYSKILLAAGFRNSDFSIGLRYFLKMNRGMDMDVLNSYFCFNFNACTSFSNLRKHYLYFE